jgi:hypothetical protein
MRNGRARRGSAAGEPRKNPGSEYHFPAGEASQVRRAEDDGRTGVLTTEFTQGFAEDWIAAWNSHDLERILSHYTDDFEMSSPVIVEFMGEPSGMLKGKVAVREYWSRALARIPDLHFDLLEVFVGASSIVIHYRGPRGSSAEAFWFNDAGKVHRAAAHYVEG